MGAREFSPALTTRSVRECNHVEASEGSAQGRGFLRALDQARARQAQGRQWMVRAALGGFKSTVRSIERWLRGVDVASGPAASLPVAWKRPSPPGRRRSAASNPLFGLLRGWLRGVDLNHRPLGYACHDSFHCPDCSGSWTGLSLHPRTGCAAVRVPAVKSLHLPFERCGPQGLARGYPANGFPEFDR
jgi:hypothetical protein